MTIQKTLAGTSLTVAPEGRLDTITSPQLESELRADMNAVTNLVFDLANLTYISSAGLRVILSAQKAMNKKGTMVLRNVRPEIMEIFEITGFSSILTIE
ncbi:MAG: STAS domain-containing protein [Lachnospiraceae bacterium]|nr:STAS domain-containing protein [Lachnospiraceae bacterium]